MTGANHKMSEKYVDPVNGDNANDGLSWANAKATITGLNAILNNGDVANMADGTYPHTDGIPKLGIDSNPIIWRARSKHQAIVTRPTGTYFTIDDAGGTENAYFDGVQFLDMAGLIFGFNNSNSVVFRNCLFKNCQKISERITVGHHCHQTYEFCRFEECGDGSDRLFDFIDQIDGKTEYAGVRNCTFYACKVDEEMLKFTKNGTAYTDGCLNNIIEACECDVLVEIDAVDASVEAFIGQMDGNTYYNNTVATAWFESLTAQRADIAAWNSATGVSDDDRNEDPQMLDPGYGLFNITISGNSHATGIGGKNRGSEIIGIALSNNAQGAIWDAPSQSGGIHAGGQLTVDVNPSDGDTFTIGTQTYRIMDTPAQANDIQREAALADTQANMVAAVSLTGTEGVEYYAGTTRNTSAFLRSFSSDIAEVVAIDGGVGGNSIATTETFAAGSNVFDAATLGTYRAGVDVNAMQLNDRWTLDGQANQSVGLTFTEFDTGQENKLVGLIMGKYIDAINDLVVDTNRFDVGYQLKFKYGATQGACQGASFVEYTEGDITPLTGARWVAFLIRLTNLP